MRKIICPAFLLFFISSFLLGIVYPLTVTLFSQIILPSKATGSLIKKDKKVIGSRLIGQQFADPKYFWGRLSYTANLPYNSSSSGASNFCISNLNLIKAIKERIELLRRYDPENKMPIPVDLVTGSASGLDPHISPAATFYQTSRIAKARKKSEEEIRNLIKRFIEPPTLGFLGEARVNVMLLNLALDEN